MCGIKKNKSTNQQLQEVKRLVHEENVNVNLRDENVWRKRTALPDASENGHLEIVKLLLESGANVNIRNYRGDRTALDLASMYNKLEVVNFLKNWKMK